MIVTYLILKKPNEVEFLLSRRIWKVYFKDGSWILANDQGNGWYYPLTNFNSYKLLKSYKF